MGGGSAKVAHRMARQGAPLSTPRSQALQVDKTAVLSLVASLRRDAVEKREEVVQNLIDCALGLPGKTPLYALIIGESPAAELGERYVDCDLLSFCFVTHTP